MKYVINNDVNIDILLIFQDLPSTSGTNDNQEEQSQDENVATDATSVSILIKYIMNFKTLVETYAIATLNTSKLLIFTQLCKDKEILVSIHI